MEAAGDISGKAEALNNIASVHLALMNWSDALFLRDGCPYHLPGGR